VGAKNNQIDVAVTQRLFNPGPDGLTVRDTDFVIQTGKLRVDPLHF